MHDFDRTQVGFGPQMESFEYDFETESGEAESGQTEMGEAEAMELASELLELESEQEFENFLGDVFSKAVSAVRGFANSSVGQALGGALKSAAKQILPVAGQAVGGYFGGSTGSQIGQKLGSAAGNLFEADYEGQGESYESEDEDREWEAATNFVKLAHEAAKIASQAPPTANPARVARQAVIQAAQKHAPHLVQGSTTGSSNGSGSQSGAQLTRSSQSGSQSTQTPSQFGLSGPHLNDGESRSGRWVRRHNRIIVFGI